MSDTTLQVQEAAPLARRSDAGYSVAEVKAQVEQIQDLMRSLMTEGEHFGKVPGTDKPTLLQPGAQKIALMFRAHPEYTKERVDLPDGHREWIITCDLLNRDGSRIGQGFGSCSTMETKYRWRKSYEETEVGDVPKAYWEVSRDDPDCNAKRQAVLSGIHGPGKYKAKKDATGSWKVFRVEGSGERVPNTDIADTYNTVLKMATKRALVGAVLQAFAASDIFTQDVEDFDQSGGDHEQPKATKAATAPVSPDTVNTTPKDEKADLRRRYAALFVGGHFTQEERAQMDTAMRDASKELPSIRFLIANYEGELAKRKQDEDSAVSAAFDGAAK